MKIVDWNKLGDMIYDSLPEQLKNHYKVLAVTDMVVIEAIEDDLKTHPLAMIKYNNSYTSLIMRELSGYKRVGDKELGLGKHQDLLRKHRPNLQLIAKEIEDAISLPDELVYIAQRIGAV